MPDVLKELAFRFSFQGMDGSVHPAAIGENAVSRAVNVKIENQLPTTRDCIREIPISNASDELAIGAFQGARFYNPALGQSQQTFAEDESSIVAVVNNAMHHVLINDQSPSITSAKASLISKTTELENIFHLSWLYQAENYIISQDGNNKTLVWDGELPAEFSPGYNTTTKTSSRLANGASAGGYAHGRIIQVVERRKILVNDFLHKSDLSSPKNILESTEQVYLISGSHFSPPSSMGDVMAIELLPQQNTIHGHGVVMIHCEEGIFSLDISLPNRDEWRNQSLTRHAVLATGARGPYAIALYDGDQIFRSRHGIQSLRSAAGENRNIGNPLRPISDPVSTWLDVDHEPFIRFTSLEKWAWRRKLFCTVAPWVAGPYRGSRGAVALNFSPVPGESAQEAWEGLITMPPEFPNIIQFVNGVFNGRDRLFAFCSKREESTLWTNHLVEFDPNLTSDVLADGTKRRVSCQLQSRILQADSFWKSGQYSRGVLYLKSVRGDLDYGVWVRTDTNKPWIYWTGDKIRPDKGDWFNPDPPQDMRRQLGEVPQEAQRGRGLQVMLRWKGYAQIEGLRIGYQGEEPGDETETEDPRTSTEVVVHYDDFEYSSDDNRWEDVLS